MMMMSVLIFKKNNYARVEVNGRDGKREIKEIDTGGPWSCGDMEMVFVTIQ